MGVVGMMVVMVLGMGVVRGVEFETARGVRATTDLRIINGKPVSSSEDIPWATLLVFGCQSTEGVGICAGSLIQPDVVLTAAHCAPQCPNNDAFALASVGQSASQPDQQVQVRQILNHPQYSPQALQNDIAVWVLDGTMKVSKYPKLATPGTGTVDTKVVAAGWGRTEDGTTPDILRFVGLEIQPDSICEGLFGPVFSGENQVCAGTDQQGFDTCNGDSGGPLYIAGSNDVIVGLTSFGSPDCGSLDGAVYTRVSSYIQDFLPEAITASGSTPTFATGSASDDDDNMTVWIVIVCVVLGAAIVVAIVAFVFIQRRRRAANLQKAGNGSYKPQSDIYS